MVVLLSCCCSGRNGGDRGSRRGSRRDVGAMIVIIVEWSEFFNFDNLMRF